MASAIQAVCRILLTVVASFSILAIAGAGSKLILDLDSQVQANAVDVRAIVHSTSLIAASTEDTAASVSGISASVSQMAYKASQPQTTGQKIVSGLKIGALIVSKFVP